MPYPVKTLHQLPLLLKSYRKANQLTQTAMAQKLGITQQSYAHFEANPAKATLERFFIVLRFLNVEISLDQQTSGVAAQQPSPVVAEPAARFKKARPVKSQAVEQAVRRKTEASAYAKRARLTPKTGKKDIW